VPLYIKDDETTQLVGELAKLCGLSKQAAVKMAVKAELDRSAEAVPLRDRFAALRAAHPLPPPTGDAAERRSSMTYPAGYDRVRRCICLDRHHDCGA